VWIKNKWLRAFLMLPLAILRMHAKNIENILREMNEAKSEFTLRDESGEDDGNWPPNEIEAIQSPPEPEGLRASSVSHGSEKASASSSQERRRSAWSWHIVVIMISETPARSARLVR
jgi:hypothetical protein